MTPRPGLRPLFVLLATASSLATVPAAAQVVAEPVIRGQVLLGDTVLRSGLVVLHRVSSGGEQGGVDSTAVDREGAFTLRLPAVPAPDGSDVYFASVRHAGILYFGRPVTLPVHLDSLYEIQAYDTLVATGGARISLQGRSLFLEEGEGGQWSVTDLFQLRNEEPRTLVAPPEGSIWRHALPPEAVGTQVTQLDFTSAGGGVLDGDLLITAPLPPGDRVFVVRYTVPDLFLEIPVTAPTAVLEVLVKEPAPPLHIAGLEQGAPVELDPGSVFRHFTASEVTAGSIRLEEGQGQGEPPVRGMAVFLALTLAGVAAWTLQARYGPSQKATANPPPTDRPSLVLEIARLDETFATQPHPTPEEKGAYEARRRELLHRLRLLK